MPAATKCKGPHTVGPFAFDDGGGGNRTLVRMSVQNHPYVRRYRFMRRSGLAQYQPCRTLSPGFSLLPSRFRQALARFCDSMAAPRVSSVHRRSVKRALAQLTQPLPVQSWQLNRSRRFYQEPGPGHAAIPSTYPSKPVAPVGTGNIVEPGERWRMADGMARSSAIRHPSAPLIPPRVSPCNSVQIRHTHASPSMQSLCPGQDAHAHNSLGPDVAARGTPGQAIPPGTSRGGEEASCVLTLLERGRPGRSGWLP